jgi:hypothetical protein
MIISIYVEKSFEKIPRLVRIKSPEEPRKRRSIHSHIVLSWKIFPLKSGRG